MLVLTRRESEAVCIGDEVRVIVGEVRGRRVKLYIQAPEGVLVDRLEVRQQRLQFEQHPEQGPQPPPTTVATVALASEPAFCTPQPPTTSLGCV